MGGFEGTPQNVDPLYSSVLFSTELNYFESFTDGWRWLAGIRYLELIEGLNAAGGDISDPSAPFEAGFLPTTDGNYAPHTGTMLHSAMTATAGASFRIYVLCGELSEQDRAGLLAVARGFAAELSFLPISRERLGDFPRERFHHSCWYRMLLPELLPLLARDYNPRIAEQLLQLSRLAGEFFRDGAYRFAPQHTVVAGPGSAGCLIPPFEYHTLANANSITAGSRKGARISRDVSILARSTFTRMSSGR